MIRLVLTGGIATGKSSFLERVAAKDPGVGVFDCDGAVDQLLTEPQVLARVRALFGDRVFSGGEVLDRSALRRVVFAEESCRRQLEALLHPQVRSRCEKRFSQYAAEYPEGLFVADVPLYYETDGSYPNDMVAVVATSNAMQRQRLRHRSRLSTAEAESMIQAQIPIEEKVLGADLLIWNEGPLERLDDQAELFLERLRLN